MMQELLTRHLVYGEEPPRGVYFTIKVSFLRDPSKNYETDPIENFPLAFIEAEDLSKEMVKETPHSTVMEIEPNDDDDSHLVVTDEEGIIALFSILTHDNRGKTLH